jgi:lysophospholipase L1-like esterase
VPFGYNPLVPIGSSPTRYVGYPELASRSLHLKVTNLSCPGQTTGGFLSLTGDDNGCFPFRVAAKLHAPYTGTQLDAAVAFLKSHPHTRLVTLTLGANDLFVCQKTTANHCTAPAEVATTLKTVAAHLTTALTAIRAVYRGPIVAVTYYTTDYADPVGVAGITALNTVLAQVTTGAGGAVADAFTAVGKAAAGSGGDACKAGLLIALPTGGCDVHPTRRGARAIASTLRPAHHR